MVGQRVKWPNRRCADRKLPVQPLVHTGAVSEQREISAQSPVARENVRQFGPWFTPWPLAGPNCRGGLDHIWPKPGTEGAGIFFFGIWWGVKIDLTLCVYAKKAPNFMGNSNMHAKQEIFFTPDLPPQIWLLGPDPHWVTFVLQTPHMCLK